MSDSGDFVQATSNTRTDKLYRWTDAHSDSNIQNTVAPVYKKTWGNYKQRETGQMWTKETETKKPENKKQNKKPRSSTVMNRAIAKRKATIQRR